MEEDGLEAYAELHKQLQKQLGQMATSDGGDAAQSKQVQQLHALNQQMQALNALTAEAESGGSALDELKLAAHMDQLDSAMTAFEEMLRCSDDNVRAMLAESLSHGGMAAMLDQPSSGAALAAPIVPDFHAAQPFHDSSLPQIPAHRGAPTPANSTCTMVRTSSQSCADSASSRRPEESTARSQMALVQESPELLAQLQARLEGMRTECPDVTAAARSAASNAILSHGQPAAQQPAGDEDADPEPEAALNSLGG